MTRLLAVAIIAFLAACGADKTSVSELGADRPGFLLIVAVLTDGLTTTHPRGRVSGY